ncbi:ArsR/SmtB family transcription factor [Cohnella caldifontis]|uniref:ArsR/SmtB family transcription factor n=1 Tax=Cohnella caldifontis TaxID=3027471 RepID=UPI0023ED9CA7|nr:metalloregulator ArsR/SmtB family transcription factor [Cohnella sp. YIM B05605]
MLKELPLLNESNASVDFSAYESKFKALADQKRLQIMYELTQRGNICVCDLCEVFEMPQSKISYHLKILLDAGLIKRETRGTWSYYELNQQEVNRLLSPELCCIFRRSDDRQTECCSSNPKPEGSE